MADCDLLLDKLDECVQNKTISDFEKYMLLSTARYAIANMPTRHQDVISGG